MKIGIVTPAPPRSLYGNRITALRWAKILKSLGHRVSLTQTYGGEPYDLLIALHARRSYPAARQFSREHPQRLLIVALTGTDLYRDLARSRKAQRSLDLATRIVTLQPKALETLKPEWREKTHVIYQSARAPDKRGITGRSDRGVRSFDVCVAGHLRPVKDPFRAALAARRLPPSSRIRILHLGAARTQAMAARAHSEMKANPRYHWLGEKPSGQVWRILRQSKLCVLSSKLEGGANILSEAIVAGTPVIASRIPGSVGILGEDYPGYFTVGSTDELAALLGRAETNSEFLATLQARCRKLRPLFAPAREKAAWRNLLAELCASQGS
jgi:putative glycosyltransferase (TIGR04348 family)